MREKSFEIPLLAAGIGPTVSEVLVEGGAGWARARPWEEVGAVMTYTKTRDFDVFGVPAHLLAATDLTSQGRTVSTDRRLAPVTGLVPPAAGFGNPAGVLVGATPVRGTSMI